MRAPPREEVEVDVEEGLEPLLADDLLSSSSEDEEPLR